MTMRGILSAGGGAKSGFVRPGLELVGKRLELRARARSALDGEGDQVIREPSVLGEQRAMEVCPDQVEALHSLVSVATVVPVTVHDAAERHGIRAEVGASAMVLEAGEDLWPCAEVDLDRDVADQPRTWLSDRLQVGDPEPGNGFLSKLVAVAEQLIPATYREQGGPVLDGEGDRVPLRAQHVLRDQHLV